MSSSSSKLITSRTSSAADNSISDFTLLDASAPTLADPNASSSSRTADDVWRDIVSGDNKGHFRLKEEAPDAVMTLEEFLLAKTGIASDEVDEEEQEEDVKAFPFPVGGGRGKRGRGGLSLEPVDRAAQQRQRRMIKNRESAARSRERKQAYQVELESLAVRLEEEHACLLKEKAERSEGRLKELMETVIPVEEKPRGRRVLRRLRST